MNPDPRLTGPIIGAILAIIAYFIVRPIDRTISYAVCGAALILFVYACIMDIADDITYSTYDFSCQL